MSRKGTQARGGAAMGRSVDPPLAQGLEHGQHAWQWVNGLMNGGGEGVGLGTEEVPVTWDVGSPRALKLLVWNSGRCTLAGGESASSCPGAKQTEGWAGRHRTDEMLGPQTMWTREARRSEGEFKGMTGPGMLVTGRMRDQGPSRIRKLEGVSQSQGRRRQSDCCHHGVGKVWGVTMDCGPTD